MASPGQQYPLGHYLDKLSTWMEMSDVALWRDPSPHSDLLHASQARLHLQRVGLGLAWWNFSDTAYGITPAPTTASSLFLRP
jgi:hypothetical protein